MNKRDGNDPERLYKVPMWLTFGVMGVWVIATILAAVALTPRKACGADEVPWHREPVNRTALLLNAQVENGTGLRVAEFTRGTPEENALRCAEVAGALNSMRVEVFEDSAYWYCRRPVPTTDGGAEQ